jgi:hypothetical protein
MMSAREFDRTILNGIGVFVYDAAVYKISLSCTGKVVCEDFMRVLVLTFYFHPDLCVGSFRTTALVTTLA